MNMNEHDHEHDHEHAALVRLIHGHDMSMIMNMTKSAHPGRAYLTQSVFFFKK